VSNDTFNSPYEKLLIGCSPSAYFLISKAYFSMEHVPLGNVFANFEI